MKDAAKPSKAYKLQRQQHQQRQQQLHKQLDQQSVGLRQSDKLDHLAKTELPQVQVSPQEKSRELETILGRLETFSLKMEESKIAEYMTYLDNPGRMIRVNLLMGMARGFGLAIGLGILSALAIYILQLVIRLNLPVISNFLVDILTQANQYIELYR
jgi:hypothetical protein